MPWPRKKLWSIIKVELIYRTATIFVTRAEARFSSLRCGDSTLTPCSTTTGSGKERGTDKIASSERAALQPEGVPIPDRKISGKAGDSITTVACVAHAALLLVSTLKASAVRRRPSKSPTPLPT